MSVYLNDVPLSVAKIKLEQALRDANLWRVLGIEVLPLNENANGRVLADPVWAKISSPHYHASAMDGFAVRAADTVGARPGNPITLSHIGDDLEAGFAYVDTGDAIPSGYDAVIPIEEVESLDEQEKSTLAIRRPDMIRIRASVTPWSHVRPLGEDIIQTQLVLPAGQSLRPVDLGAIAAAGHISVKVACKPRIAVIPTGTELVPLGSELRAGDILEYNSLVLAALVNGWGGTATRFPITPDNFDAICARVEEAGIDHDLIMLNAGSSAGSEDFSAQVVKKLGTLIIHGVAIRPGHPVILGLIGVNNSNTNLSSITNQPRFIPIIGVPGYPVSAALTAEIFVEPLIALWTGRPAQEKEIEKASLTRKITSLGGDDDYVRVVMGKVGSKMLAAPLARGAGVISSLSRADGLVLLPRGIQGAEAGDEVDVHLYRSRVVLDKTIFCIGSHDMTLDILAQFLSNFERRMVSANTGSQGGLIALKHGEAHLAGAHLLDPETGEYNIPAIRKYLHGIPVNVYGFVGREQGLMVKRGNPKGVRDLKDLGRPDIFFINRQRGAGTRVLLDFHLGKIGTAIDTIQGYNQEEYTHLGVAAAIASGRADCGLGIPAAAQSLNLDFIPLFTETYQLIIPRIFVNTDLLVPFFKIISDHTFQQAVGKMPGYDVSNMGKLVAEV